MTAMLICLVGYVLIFALCCWKPNAGRIFMGFFFLLMAWGVNGVISATNPHLFVELGANSFIPAYQTLFTGIVGAHPLFWGLVVIAYETTTGLLILSRGARVRVGLLMGIIFAVGILPFNIQTLANAVLALALQFLISKDFPLSLPDLLRTRIHLTR